MKKVGEICELSELKIRQNAIVKKLKNQDKQIRRN